MPVDHDLKSVVHSVVAKEIRPLLQSHGGDIEIDDCDSATGTVHVRFCGACSGCPGAQRTLKELVETTLIEHCPGVCAVETASISKALLDEALALLRNRDKAAHFVRNG